MVGAVQFLAGLLRAGSLARFVSEPVLTGFTAGAGLYIVINQVAFVPGDRQGRDSGDGLRFRAAQGGNFRSGAPVVRSRHHGAHHPGHRRVHVLRHPWNAVAGQTLRGTACRRPSSRSCSPRSSSPRLAWPRNRTAPREGGGRHPAVDPRAARTCASPMSISRPCERWRWRRSPSRSWERWNRSPSARCWPGAQGIRSTRIDSCSARAWRTSGWRWWVGLPRRGRSAAAR